MIRRRACLTALFLALLSVFPASLPAQNFEEDVGAADDGESLTIRIAVMGPGDELYYWWGHIALIIEHRKTRRSRFYDYGLFSFNTENFFANFAMGRLLYSCGASPTERSLGAYIAANRDITFYTLDLPPERREAVRLFAERNILPANRDYYYHHFKDNCATRIRDILDLATGGQFRERFGEAPGRYTLRQHVRRHTWFSPFMDWFLNFLMGQDIDRPITVWEEMFLPSEIGRRIGEFTYTGEDGIERPLVSGVEIFNRAEGRPPVLEKPHRQWPWALLTGILIALAFIPALVLRERGSFAGRAFWALSQGLAGLFFGAAGLLLFFMTFFTNHDYTFHNINIIYANPFLLAALPLGICWLRAGAGKGREKLDAALKILWTGGAALCLLSGALKVFPGLYQQNQVDMALFFPIALPLGFASLPLAGLVRRVFWRWFD